MSSERVTTLQQWSSSRSPPDASRAPFPHRSPRRSSANAAGGGLKPPPAGRLRRASNPSSLEQHRIKKTHLPTWRAPLRVRGTLCDKFVGNQDHLRVWAGQAGPSGCDDHDRQASCDRLVAIAAGDDHAARRRHSLLLLVTTALTSAFGSGWDLYNQTRRSTRPNSEAPTLMSHTPAGVPLAGFVSASWQDFPQG